MSEQAVELTTELAKALGQLNKILGELKPMTASPSAKAEVKAAAKTKAKAAAAKPPKAPDLVRDFQRWFFTSPEENLYNVKRGQWECRVGDPAEGTAHVLLFHSLLTDKIKNASDVIGIRPIGSQLGIFNGSRITYGTSWHAQKEPQAIAEECGAVPVPFENVTSKEEGAGLDLSKLTIMEWTGAEKLIIPPVKRQRDWTGDFYVTERHFAGAMVLKIENKYFLFDTDREELSCHGFNPFFTQLPGVAKTVREAYDLLMPEAVKAAVTGGKKEVIRQGEFFFVEADQAEVEKAVLSKSKGPKQVRKFFYNQLLGRMKLLGAAQVNCYRVNEGLEVADFLGRCRSHAGGLLPETPNKLSAKTALVDYVKTLDERVGPPTANPPPKKEEDDRWDEGWNGQGTHLDHIADELASRLDGDPEEDFEDDPPRTGSRRPPSVEGVPIRYRMRIGAQDAGARNGRSANNHLATGVYRKAAKEVYAIGSVFHQGREHRPIFLDKWYRVYPNTAVVNWTVSGDVD